MKKSWSKLYFFIYSFLFLLLTIITILGFYSPIITSIINKYNFESIYINTDYDFIIPSPSFDQISKLENSSNGIEVVTPYYAFTTHIKVENHDVQSNVILLDDYSKINYTPYNEKRIIKGAIEKKSNIAVIDDSFKKQNNCNIGDNISFTIKEKSYSFVVVAISENNPDYDGSIALMLDLDLSREINDNIFKYSAAYVRSSNYDVCNNYLMNEYKPLGRLKSKECFDNEEAYNTHVSNFYNADWSQEITNLKENYKSLSVKYDKVPYNAFINTIIMCLIFTLFILFFNIIAIVLPKQKGLFKDLLVKKKGNLNDIISFYYKGNLWVLFVSILIIVFGITFVNLLSSSFSYFSLTLSYSIAPVCAIIGAIIINILIIKFIIKKMYLR